MRNFGDFYRKFRIDVSKISNESVQYVISSGHFSCICSQWWENTFDN